MPRKVDPRFNEQSDALPTDFVDAFVLSEEVECFLPKGVAEKAKSETLRALKHALGLYAWEMEAGPYQYSRAEASQALRDLMAKERFDRKSIGALNQRAFDFLYMLADEQTQSWILGSDDDEAPIEGIVRSAQRVIAMHDRQRGPEKSIPLAYLVNELCHIYEELTGKKVTHHTKDGDLGYTQDARTDAGRFVTGIIETVFNDIPKTRINQCLREFVEFRPQRF